MAEQIINSNYEIRKRIISKEHKCIRERVHLEPVHTEQNLSCPDIGLQILSEQIQ